MKSFTDNALHNPFAGSATIKFLADFDAKLYACFGRLQERLRLYSIARVISFTGDGYLYFAIAILAWLLVPETGQQFLMVGLCATGIELPLYWVLKKFFKRKRPYLVLTAFERHHIPSDEFSFPSGHATAGFLMAYLVGHFFPGYTLLMYIWATLIGLSRVLLRVHYVSDIVAGMLLGTGIGMVTLWLFGL